VSTGCLSCAGTTSASANIAATGYLSCDSPTNVVAGIITKAATAGATSVGNIKCVVGSQSI